MRVTVSIPVDLKQQMEDRHLKISGIVQELLRDYLKKVVLPQNKEPISTTIHVSEKTMRILKLIRSGQTYDQVILPLLVSKLIHDKNLLKSEDEYFYYLKKEAEPYLERIMEYVWDELNECYVVRKM